MSISTALPPAVSARRHTPSRPQRPDSRTRVRQHRVSRAGSSPRPVSAGHPRPARPTPHVSVLTRHPSHPAWSPFSPMTSQRPCLQIQAGIRMCSGPHSTHNGHRPHLHPSTERGTFLTRRSTNSTRRCVHVVEKGRRAGRTVRPALGFTSRTASQQAVSVRFLRPTGPAFRSSPWP